MFELVPIPLHGLQCRSEFLKGSFLGPLLFLLYINDLPSIIQYSDINIYADDTEIHFCSDSVDDLHSKLQIDLDGVSEWLISNRLCVNSGKSVSMLIGLKRRVKNLCLELFLNGKELVCVEKTKYLGLLIDRYLTWEDHIMAIIRSCRSKLYALNRL